MDEKIVSSISSQAVPQQVAGTVTIRPMIAQDVERVHLIDTLSFNMPWPASSYRYELFENSAALLHVAEIIDEQEIKVIVGMIVTWLIVDEVIYSDASPWPAGSDGTGKALRRIHTDAAHSGNDPTNWTVATPSPGMAP